MDVSHRVRPQVEPFEDRVVPARGGFDHTPDPPGGTHAVIVREQPHGFEHAGPFVGAVPLRRGPDVTLSTVATVRVVARGEIPVTLPVGQLLSPLVVAAAQAEPAVAPSYLPPTSTAVTVTTPSSAPASLPPPGVLVEAGPAGVRAAAFTTTTTLAATTDEPLPTTDVEPTPAPPESPARPEPPVPSLPAWDFPPLLVDLPGVVPLAGALGVDLGAVTAGVREALDFVSDVAPVPADGWGANGWLAAAAALLGGAGWAGARARRPRPTPDAVFLGWGERDDRRRG